MSWFSNVFKQQEKIFEETNKLFEEVFSKDDFLDNTESKIQLDILLSNQEFEDTMKSTKLPWHHPKLLSKLKEAFNIPADANLIGFKFTINGVEACMGDKK